MKSIEVIEARLNAAQRGPWVSYVLVQPEWAEQAASDIRWLLDEVKRLTEERDDISNQVSELEKEVRSEALFLALHGVSGYELRAVGEK